MADDGHLQFAVELLVEATGLWFDCCVGLEQLRLELLNTVDRDALGAAETRDPPRSRCCIYYLVPSALISEY